MISAPSKEKLAELVAAKAHVIVVHGDDSDFSVYFRRARKAEVERCMAALDKADNSAGRMVAGEDLGHDVLLYPLGRSDEAKALFEEYPRFADSLSTDVLKLAQGDRAARAKKATA